MQYLTRGESIFRKEWDIDDEYIREKLSLKEHLVHLPYLRKYIQNEGSDLVDLSDEVRVKLFDKYRASSHLKFLQNAFKGYWKILSKHQKQVTDFLTAFSDSIDTTKLSTMQPSIISTATSGIGSLPSSQIK